MSSVEHHIRSLAPDGVQINLWATERGFHANVKEQGSRGWTVVSGPDPIAALAEALRQRAAGVASREVVAAEDAAPVQIDLEEAIAATAPTPVSPADEFDGLLG